MRRVFLAWEIGGGRGHVVHLAAVAASLQRRGYRNTAYLVHLEHAAELAPHCDDIGQAPLLPFRTLTGNDVPGSRYGDWLGLHHFDEPLVIRSAIDRWRALLIANRSEIVVAEQAPCAVLAARSLGLPAVQVGVPVTAPPAGMPAYPPYLSECDKTLYDEAMLRDAVNEAIVEYGLPPLTSLPAIYTCEDQIVATIELLDRYAEWRTRPRVPPVIGGWEEPGERRRQELFVYLSTVDRLDPVILTAIASIELPTRVVVANNLPLAVATIERRGALVETRPRAPGEIASSARVLVHAGNHGMCCLGARGGLPQVTLSAQVEHVFDGRALMQAGAGLMVERQRWTVPNIHAAIREAWESSAMATRAAALAEELAPQFAGDPGEMTADRIEAVMR